MGSSLSDLKRKQQSPTNNLDVEEIENDFENGTHEKFEDISHSDLGGILNPRELSSSANGRVTPKDNHSIKDQVETAKDTSSRKPPDVKQEPFVRKPSTVVPLPKLVPSPTHTECDFMSTKVTPKHNILTKPPALDFPDLGIKPKSKHSPTFSPSEHRINTALAKHKRNLSDLKLEELS